MSDERIDDALCSQSNSFCRYDFLHQVSADDVGKGLALWTSDALSRSVVDSTPVMAPRTRIRRTSAARIDSLDAEDAILREIIGQALLRAKVAGMASQFADDEAFDLRPARFAVLAR